MAINTEKREKSEIVCEGHGLWRKNWKTWKMRHKHCMTWNMARNTEKCEKWEMHSVGSGIFQEYFKRWKIEKCTLKQPAICQKQKTKKQKNWKTWKRRNAHCRTWNMAKNTEKRGKSEMLTVGSGISRVTWKTWKMRHKHYTTWNMAKNNEKGGKW